MKINTTHVVLISLSAVLTVGCATDRLPRLNAKALDQRIASIPADASPVFEWYAQRDALATYWGRQDVDLQVRAHIPADWQHPGDGQWEVRARNADGIAIPFLGVVRPYTGPNSDELSVLVPPVDMAALRDGLYLVIFPNISQMDGEITSIQPVAMLSEIRGHSWKPFRVRIPLVPAQPSPLTPPPPPDPAQPPAGTPIPVN